MRAKYKIKLVQKIEAVFQRRRWKKEFCIEKGKGSGPPGPPTRCAPATGEKFDKQND